MEDHNSVGIGGIGNYYGGLSVKRKNGKAFWSIENYTGENWEEIPDYLYSALMKFEDGEDKDELA